MSCLEILFDFALEHGAEYAGKRSEMQQRLKGRTPEQKSVIKYFYGSGGCLSKGLTDEQYEGIVMAKAQSINFKKKALGKIGLDEDQVKEIEPVHFEGYVLSDKGDVYVRRGSDKIWRSSAYQVSWIFFSSTQVYVYKNTMNFDSDELKESTEEYFYKDITNFSTSTDTVEMEAVEKVNCKGKAAFSRQKIDTCEFRLVVPGEKFSCSMRQSDYTERAIQGMKAKLREKKA